MSGRQRRNRSGMKRIISGRRSVHPEEPGENRRRQGRRCGNPVFLILAGAVRGLSVCCILVTRR